MNTKNTIKRLAAVTIAALAFGFASVANATPALTDVTAKLHAPWDGKVDISYTASGVREAMLRRGPELPPVVMAVDTATHVTNVASSAAISGDATFADGKHDIVWDMGRQGMTEVNPATVKFLVTCAALAGDDYETLRNKPQINGVTLAGDKAAVADLGVLTLDDIFERLYPVGKIYVSLGTALPPLFTENGRTWEKLAEGQFLMNTTGETGATGGADSVALTADSMPSHTHAVKGNSGDAGSHSHQQKGYWTVNAKGGGNTVQCQSKDYQDEVYSYGGEGVGNHQHYINLTSGAAGVATPAAFDNRPAYLAVSMWKRTN